MANPTRLPNIHPGEVLLEEFLKPMEISQNALARAIRVPPRRVQRDRAWKAHHYGRHVATIGALLRDFGKVLDGSSGGLRSRGSRPHGQGPGRYPTSSVERVLYVRGSDVPKGTRLYFGASRAVPVSGMGVPMGKTK